MTVPTPETSLSDVRAYLHEAMEDGVSCPACDRYVRVYRRRLNAGMAVALIKLYKAGGAYEYVDVRHGIDPLRMIGKFVWWGFVTRAEERGFWKVTDDGVAFIKGQAVPGAVDVYNRRFLRYSPGVERITIVEALGNKFDYEELMSEKGERPDEF